MSAAAAAAAEEVAPAAAPTPPVVTADTEIAAAAILVSTDASGDTTTTNANGGGGEKKPQQREQRENKRDETPIEEIYDLTKPIPKVRCCCCCCLVALTTLVSPFVSFVFRLFHVDDYRLAITRLRSMIRVAACHCRCYCCPYNNSIGAHERLHKYCCICAVLSLHGTARHTHTQHFLCCCSSRLHTSPAAAAAVVAQSAFARNEGNSVCVFVCLRFGYCAPDGWIDSGCSQSCVTLYQSCSTKHTQSTPYW